MNSNATLTVQAAVVYAQTQARQGQDFRVQINTGITNSDRYLAFTNIAVLNNGTNADIVTTNLLSRFLPKDASETLSYDADGNVTNDGRWTYTWDALNRLTAIESQSSAPTNSKHKLAFTYDAGGRRIQKVEYLWNPSTSGYQPSTTNKFLYNGWDLIAELDGSGNALRSYGWLGKSGGLLWVKDHASGEFHVPSFDGNRNVTRLIKYSDHTVSAEYEYAPFGSLLRATGPMALANPIRFSSEYHDDITGLVYYGYRYYSPQTHRWLSKDPIGHAGGLNLYGFVGNDPVNEVDELGLSDFNMPGYFGWENYYVNLPTLPPPSPTFHQLLQLLGPTGSGGGCARTASKPCETSMSCDCRSGSCGSCSSRGNVGPRTACQVPKDDGLERLVNAEFFNAMGASHLGVLPTETATAIREHVIQDIALQAGGGAAFYWAGQGFTTARIFWTAESSMTLRQANSLRLMMAEMNSAPIVGATAASRGCMPLVVECGTSNAGREAARTTILESLLKDRNEAISALNLAEKNLAEAQAVLNSAFESVNAAENMGRNSAYYKSAQQALLSALRVASYRAQVLQAAKRSLAEAQAAVHTCGP